ncbi:30S ribosomal protein S8 [Clostridium sediminicola]|uniref:30S ribosomal protein S8 n=1 Tax=Clostridium sediminicola TaxID=3114879 RepID=UPI0031F26448
MVMTDPIADMLTRIRNANVARHNIVEIPSSNTKRAIADILVKEGYVKGVEEYEDGPVKMLRLGLKYIEGTERTITGLKRISKPGLRVYCQKDTVPQVLNGLGIAIVSTNKGVITDKEARNAGLGGEVICYVW